MIWFWTIFVAVVILWYIIVTLLVGIKGGRNVKQMLSKMKEDYSNGK